MSTRRINIVALLFILGTVECCNSAKSNEANTKGLLITGGDGEASRSVEIFSLNNRDLQCELEPDLPDIRTHHTQNGFIICGGYNTVSPVNTGGYNSCLTLAADGQWNVSHQLKYKRYQHSSWDTPDGGVLLIGGHYSRTTTELLTDDGGSVEKFKLKQRSESGLVDHDQPCLIDEGDWFLLTGGCCTVSTVQRYDINGWVEDLGDLNTARWGHGCTRYNNQGVDVNIVCGGLGAGGGSYLTSCEINVAGEKTWSITSQSLPLSTMFQPRGVTIDNRVLMIGGYGRPDTLDNIYELDKDTGEWNNVGHMKVARRGHAVSVVDLEKLRQYCKN